MLLTDTLQADRNCVVLSPLFPTVQHHPEVTVSLNKAEKQRLTGHNTHFTVPCRGCLTGKAQQPQEQRYPFRSVCAVFCVSKHWYGCQCLGFWTCAQMLINLTHANAHRGCTDTLRVCAGSGLLEKNPLLRQDSNPCQYCTWHFSWRPYQLNYPPPLW